MGVRATATTRPKATKPKRGSAVAADLIDGMQSLVRDLRAGKLNARVRAATIPLPDMPPEAVLALRESLHVSQPVFADLIGASAATVKAWEQGRKPPSPMARRLLGTIQDNPDYWMKQLGRAAAGSAAKRKA